ncbi:hypothetical protein [Nitrobacter winogradskyi]|uniref:Uncharacterized protein n=1 Tax=Nitrobacter winogradskyi TaxID=913 RepID=A0ACC6ANG7_NITWI|nr:hypothetical protein [Nitrobacter winogradskyi]MCP2001214.1 hypothetical protein [Nitrobacter winogradskyi]
MSLIAYGQSSSPSTADNIGLDFFRPSPNLFQLQYGFRSAPGSTRDVTTDTLNLRSDHTFYLSPTWTVVTRNDLPLLARNTINSANPNGDYLYGIGDADIQAAVIHDLDTRWALGFGMRLITPTGTDPLGSGKWRTMPIVGFRMALPEVSKSSYFEPIFRYDVSVTGDPTRGNINNLQFGPTFNIGLPDRWFVAFFPSQDIRYNFGDPVACQTGRLFLPFDVRVGKKFPTKSPPPSRSAFPSSRTTPSTTLKVSSGLMSRGDAPFATLFLKIACASQVLARRRLSTPLRRAVSKLSSAVYLESPPPWKAGFFTARSAGRTRWSGINKSDNRAPIIHIASLLAYVPETLSAARIGVVPAIAGRRRSAGPCSSSSSRHDTNGRPSGDDTARTPPIMRGANPASAASMPARAYNWPAANSGSATIDAATRGNHGPSAYCTAAPNVNLGEMRTYGVIP